MGLHGALADAQAVGDLLVGETSGGELHDLAFSIGESFEEAADFVVVVLHACTDLLEARLRR